MIQKFEEVKQLNAPKAEVEVLRWWKEKGIFHKSTTTREDGIPFTFYEGPPTANGKPGIHHVMARTIKDLFCRYKTLKGYRVERKAGWDTHGLPVEIEVEKELGLTSRADIEAYGVAEYNQKCRQSVLKYKSLWDELTTRMGYWVDLENPYITFEDAYIESVWWSLKQLDQKGFLYKGHKIAWYSPGSGTVLSSHEVSLGYNTVQDPSVYVMFESQAEPGTFFLAWTTTPWTLVSNMALAVNPGIDYVKVSSPAHPDRRFILAEASVQRVLPDGAEILERVKGADLVGQSYRPLFPFAGDHLSGGAGSLSGTRAEAAAPSAAHSEDVANAWKVVDAAYVTTEDGTGIVHTAPAFGADDHETCRRHGIPMFNPIDKDGRFTALAGEFSGQWFKDADKTVIRDLKERSLLLRQETYSHNYPFDWRKGTPLMSYPVDSWFIRTTAVKDKMIDLNKGIQWKPESTGTGRFGTWLENNIDWAISRQRYWGTPLPIWVSEQDPEDYEVIGSIDELRRKAGLSADEELDLHRPGIDAITWTNEKGHTMRRIPDLLDVWYDSGAMPFAQWHYPFENRDRFETAFPADFIAEGVDQTRGWFYTLHALGTLLFDREAYRNVISNGLVLDEKGEKMSKSKGNTVDPFKVIHEHGADAVRWYMVSNSSPWENLKFSEAGVVETQRKVFNTILNIYSFFATYANIDEFTYSGSAINRSDRPELDRWIISRMNQVIRTVDEHLDAYEPTRAAREIEEFIEDLSNWYVRRSRRRFWKKGNTVDKTAAYQTLFECLLSLSKLMAPIAPFFSEWLYQRLNSVVGHEEEESVHLAFFPPVEQTAIDLALERRMSVARQVSSLVLRVRNKVEINVRQPLSRILIPVSKEDQTIFESVESIIREEVNIKQVDYVRDDSDVVTKTAKPVFAVLGKKVGRHMKEIAATITSLDHASISEFERKGVMQVKTADGTAYQLIGEDVEIIRTGVVGWSVESEDGITVAVDTEITRELREEGLAREFVNRVQSMRKESDYDVTDRIRVGYECSDERFCHSIERMSAYISQETLAEEIAPGRLGEADFVKSWEIDGIECTISLLRIRND